MLSLSWGQPAGHWGALAGPVPCANDQEICSAGRQKGWISKIHILSTTSTQRLLGRWVGLTSLLQENAFWPDVV